MSHNASQSQNNRVTDGISVMTCKDEHGNTVIAGPDQRQSGNPVSSVQNLSNHNRLAMSEYWMNYENMQQQNRAQKTPSAPALSQIESSVVSSQQHNMASRQDDNHINNPSINRSDNQSSNQINNRSDNQASPVQHIELINTNNGMNLGSADEMLENLKNIGANIINARSNSEKMKYIELGNIAKSNIQIYLKQLKAQLENPSQYLTQDEAGISGLSFDEQMKYFDALERRCCSGDKPNIEDHVKFYMRLSMVGDSIRKICTNNAIMVTEKIVISEKKNNDPDIKFNRKDENEISNNKNNERNSQSANRTSNNNNRDYRDAYTVTAKDSKKQKQRGGSNHQGNNNGQYDYGRGNNNGKHNYGQSNNNGNNNYGQGNNNDYRNYGQSNNNGQNNYESSNYANNPYTNNNTGYQYGNNNGTQYRNH
jgi:hypothetical protein